MTIYCESCGKPNDDTNDRCTGCREKLKESYILMDVELLRQRKA